MAFCRNCGSEVPEGNKFCSNCGTSMIINKDEALYSSDVYTAKAEPRVEQKVSTFDKFGKYFGILLMILAFVDFQSDPAIVTIILSVGIIVGSIFCFAKKYKLKGFTVTALVLAVICLLCGVHQSKRIGLFSIPGNSRVYDEVVKKTKDKDKEDKKEEVKKSETTVAKATEKPEETLTEDSAEEEVTEVKETVNGVDPDLKAFLDSYEAFINEYVDFMKKYNGNPENAVAMMGEYMEILAKYEDFAEKIDKYNSDTMSPEDAKYYLEVINRCNQKMLDIY